MYEAGRAWWYHRPSLSPSMHRLAITTIESPLLWLIVVVVMFVPPPAMLRVTKDTRNKQNASKNGNCSTKTLWLLCCRTVTRPEEYHPSRCDEWKTRQFAFMATCISIFKPIVATICLRSRNECVKYSATPHVVDANEGQKCNLLRPTTNSEKMNIVGYS